jgi:enoyl-CoA hydratase/carnithine racemase
MDYQHITCDLDGSCLIVTLNRPEKLNAYTGLMGAEIAHAFERADTDDNVRAVIVTGSGRAFCAGADVSGVSTPQEAKAPVCLPAPSRAAAGLSRRSSIAESPRSPRSTAPRSVSASP